MRFDKVIPADPLKPYIKHFIISESTLETTYKIFPSTSLVIEFQYQGQLATVTQSQTNHLSTVGITGLSDHVKVFKNSADTGTILVFFSEFLRPAQPLESSFSCSLNGVIKERMKKPEFKELTRTITGPTAVARCED